MTRVVVPSTFITECLLRPFFFPRYDDCTITSLLVNPANLVPFASRNFRSNF